MATQTLTAVDTYFFLCNPDWTFNLGDGEISTNQDLCRHIQTTLSTGEFMYLSWSCANTKRIQVGDRAYLVRSNSSPTGIIASGIVVEGLEDNQLRNLDSRYADLSAAYVDHSENTYYVCLEIDSVVDFDSPLEQRTLRQLPEFQGVNFQFQGSGKQFAPGNSPAVQSLASEWEKHSLICQSQGKGRRLVDVFVERGDKARQEKDFDSALNYYQQALDIDPEYAKALNKLKICQSIIDRAKPPAPIITPPPSPPLTLAFKDELDGIRDELDQQEPPISSDASEARKRILVSIARRQGQTKFRQVLLNAYDYKCAITGFNAEEALEAAHIIPYVETANNDPGNGLLLRADLHTLFDLNLLAIHPDTMQVFLCPALHKTEYQAIHQKQIKIPDDVALRPDPTLLKRKLEQCAWMNTV
ncbi:MAG: HNH endonuclease [Leptolyngbya sp. BL-A-14]